MNIDELNSLIYQGESETLEFKTSTGQLAEVGKTLSGFLTNSAEFSIQNCTGIAGNLDGDG